MGEPELKLFEITLRVRNNLIKGRRTRMGLSAKDAARKIGVSYTSYVQYEAMSLAPYRKDGQWRESALKLVSFFCCRPEELWPEEVLAVQKNTVVATVDSDRMLALSGYYPEQRLPPSPDEAVSAIELGDAVAVSLDTLNPRERTMLRLRFGLDGEAPLTLDEAGEVIGVSRERARQVEAKALRKLRHPSRSQELRRFLVDDEYDKRLKKEERLAAEERAREWEIKHPAYATSLGHGPEALHLPPALGGQEVRVVCAFLAQCPGCNQIMWHLLLDATVVQEFRFRSLCMAECDDCGFLWHGRDRTEIPDG